MQEQKLSKKELGIFLTVKPSCFLGKLGTRWAPQQLRSVEVAGGAEDPEDTCDTLILFSYSSSPTIVRSWWVSLWAVYTPNLLALNTLNLATLKVQSNFTKIT